MRVNTQSSMYHFMSSTMGAVLRPPQPRERDARILLIEEDASVANLLTTILEEEGYAVTRAADPDEARTLLSGRGAGAFDLVLSTPFTHAPVASYAWFDELRIHTHAPIVICARCRPLTYADHHRRGYAAFLEEPFDVEELIDLVAVLCPSQHVAPN
jgi:DNA-binding NtrC family response regulator